VASTWFNRRCRLTSRANDHLAALTRTFHRHHAAQASTRRQPRKKVLPVVKGAKEQKGAPDSRVAGQDPIPVLTDDMAAVPVLTEVMPVAPAPAQQRQTDRDSATSRKRRTLAERDVRERIAEQEARLEQTMAQLERIKAQAASVRDALATEQQNRHILEQQVSDLLTSQRKVAGPDPNIANAGTSRPVPGGHQSRREMARQLADLSDYVACRKRWWQEMESLAESNRQRISELEQEMAQRLQRETQAREVAEREQARAAELQGDLIAATRQIEDLRRQLADIRITPGGSPPAGAEQETGHSS
jgi:hypothetical protein